MMADNGNENGSPIRFAIRLDAASDLDERWLQDVMNNLKREVSSAADAEVEMFREDAPDRSKGFGAAVLGELFVEVLPDAVGGLVQFLSQWMQARHGKVVTLKFKRDGQVVDLSYNPSGSSSEDVKEILAMLMAKSPQESRNE